MFRCPSRPRNCSRVAFLLPCLSTFLWTAQAPSAEHGYPHPWSILWLPAVIALFVLLCFWFAGRLRIRRVEGRNAELAQEVRERTAAGEEIKALVERLINAQEQERTRIARELHDDLNQQITGISLSLGSIRRKLPDPDSEAFRQLEQVRDQLSRLSANVRDLSHELHPAVLDYCDAATAIRSCCKDFSSSSGLNVSFEAEGAFDDVPPPVLLCLFRVTGEALENVAQHPHTANASVRLARSGDAVRLTVSDPGVGSCPDQPPSSGGLGLISIRERVRLVSGVVDFESGPQQGTTLSVEVPVNGDAHATAVRPSQRSA